MATVVVVGAQWGDEGKGKVVDLLALFMLVKVIVPIVTNASQTINIRIGIFSCHYTTNYQMHMPDSRMRIIKNLHKIQ